MKVSEVMSKNPKTINVNATVTEAAKLMDKNNFGFLPVDENEKLVGTITDRDITIRCIAQGKDPKTTKVGDIMSKKVLYCKETDDIDKILDNFGEQKIHRLVVLDKNKKLVGDISLGDIAKKASNDKNILEHLGETVSEISLAAANH